MSEVVHRCQVCESLLDEEDLFCANCGTEAPRQDATKPPPLPGHRLSKDNFNCSGCGASMSYDASAKALRCPFCGSLDMVRQADARVVSPAKVVPFRVTRDQAVGVMRHWLGKGFFRPTGLSEAAMVVEMTPVYVPYWVFTAETHTYWTADTNQTPAGARGDWFPLSGEHRGSHPALLIGASGALTARETWDICPFDMNAGVPPEQVDLENAIVEQFSMPRKYARPLARQGLEEVEAKTCATAYVPGSSRNVHVNVLIEGMTSEPVLLPVWIMAYRFKDKLYRFLVNGQSGKATGQAPTSLAKVALVVLAVIVGILLVLLFTGGIAALFGLAALSASMHPSVGNAQNTHGPDGQRDSGHCPPAAPATVRPVR